MDTQKGPGDAYPGIELSSNTKAAGAENNRYSQPGLEPVSYSNLEAVPPQPGLSQAATDANLPQVFVPSGLHPIVAPDYAPRGDEPGTPYSNGAAPSYEYMNPNGGGHPAKDSFFRQDTICGVKRQTFWIVMAIGIVVTVAAVAIGVGLGIALHKGGDSTPSPLPSANSSTPTATTLPRPTATGATGAEVVISCPANNLTLYAAASGTNKSYLLLCGRDYSSFDGAVDLFNEPMDSVSNCIDECARQQGCVGVGYGPYNNRDTCWLKSKLGPPNVTPNWYFAVEDDGVKVGKAVR